jgi:hypothetical protein
VSFKKDEASISLQIRKVVEEAEYGRRGYVVNHVVLCNVVLCSLVAL